MLLNTGQLIMNLSDWGPYRSVMAVNNRWKATLLDSILKAQRERLQKVTQKDEHKDALIYQIQNIYWRCSQLLCLFQPY